MVEREVKHWATPRPREGLAETLCLAEGHKCNVSRGTHPRWPLALDANLRIKVRSCGCRAGGAGASVPSAGAQARAGGSELRVVFLGDSMTEGACCDSASRLRRVDGSSM